MHHKKIYILTTLLAFTTTFFNINARFHPGLDLTMPTDFDLPWHGKPMVIVIPSFNNSSWYKKNLDSVFMQQYTNFRVIYIDDCSEDDNAQLVEQYCASHPHDFDFVLIKNETRCGALANLYNAIHSCKEHEIVVTLDGDDWLAHPNVLTKLNAIYTDPHVLITYGQYVTHLNNYVGISRPFADHVIKYRNYRYSYPFSSSHPRTFYAGLFKKIQKEDLFYEDNFFQVTWDLAIMFPMLEMANGRHAYIPDILYVYNDANPINDFKVRLPLLLKCEQIIRSKPKYEPLAPNHYFKEEF